MSDNIEFSGNEISPPPPGAPPPPTNASQSARFGNEAETYAQQARHALDSGLLYFQVRIPLDQVGSANDYRAKFDPNVVDHGSAPAILTAVALQGWTVVSAGFTFRPHAQSSTSKVFMDGSHTAVHGSTIGTYLFERDDVQ